MTDHDNPSITASSILANYKPPEALLETPPTTIPLDEEDNAAELSDAAGETNRQHYNVRNNEDGRETIQIIEAVPRVEKSTPVVVSETRSSFLKTAHPVQYNLIEPTSRVAKVTSIDIAPLFSNAGVRGMVTNVSHGIFYSNPASLIVFSFVFRSGDHGFRFKNANVKITFASSTAGSKSPSANANPSPSVVKFAPRKIYGLPTREGKKDTIGGEFSLEVPAGPVTVGPSISWGKEWEYEITHRFSTVGNFWSSKYGTDWDIVYWDIKENKRTGNGIPDRFNCAVVVERERNVPFTATVEVTVDTPMGNGFLSRPWSRERPVTFVDGVEMGRQPILKEFEKLSEEQWRVLAPSDGEWESRFTDVALHKQGDSLSNYKEGKGIGAKTGEFERPNF